MSEIEESLEEPEANPYNAKKPWHQPDGPESQQTAESLFFDNNQATREAAPEDEDEPETPKRKRANYKKRYDDLKRHYDDRVSQFKQREIELVAEARAKQPDYEAPKTQDQLDKFKDEYPDLYETVETVAHMQSERQVQELQEQMSAMRRREDDILKREAETYLRNRHPDFEEIRGDDNFHNWAKEQPDEIQEWVYKNPDNATLASKAIDLYKMDNGIHTGPQRRERRTQSKPEGTAADMVSTKTTTVEATGQPKIWTEREIGAMSLDQFDAHEDEINQAVAEGRVIKS